MSKTKLSQTSSSQAERLFGTEVNSSKESDKAVLAPTNANWDTLLSSLEEFPDDFMASGREQPDI